MLRNAALLSFDDEPGETIDPALAKTKFKSSHDALDDPRLSKESKDDRGTSSTLPDAISISLASASTASGKRKADSEAPGIEVSVVHFCPNPTAFFDVCTADDPLTDAEEDSNGSDAVESTGAVKTGSSKIGEIQVTRS